MRHALCLIPLVAALLLVGCADWHWYRMDEPEAAIAPKSAPAPAPAPVSAPAPKPSSGSASSQSLDHRVVGHWRRPGDASCAAGPEIANDHGRLLITTDGQKSIHKLEGVNARRILTRVVEPAGGPRYRLRMVKGGGDGARNFLLAVENRSTGGTVTWTPCTVS